MTNKELISKLSQYSPEAEVVYSYINPIGENVEVEPEPYYNEFNRKIYL